MKTLNKVMETFWLLVALVTLGLAAYMIHHDGWDNAYLYLLFPLIAGAMFGLRRTMRKRMEKHLGDQ